MLVQILICVLIADFLSGLIHWWEDTYGLPAWPVIGKLVIEPNIRHHLDPTFMVRMGSVFDRNIQLVIISGVVIGVAWLLGVLSWQLVLITVLGAFANEVHAWHHGGGRNFIVRLLQDMALVQTPTHHSKHHKPPFERRFCILTNWVNPILDRLLFWPILEGIIWLVGIKPKRLTKARSYV